MYFHIAVYQIKDYMGLKGLLEVSPGESRIIQFTGPSGAGKTSALNGIKFLLDGASSMPGASAIHRKAVHEGAERTSGMLELVGKDGTKELARYTLKRGLTDPPGRGTLENGQAILIDSGSGKMATKPQDILDGLFTRFSEESREKRKKLAFDPQEFVSLSSEYKVNVLLQLMGQDPEKEQELDKADEEARKPINAEIKVLEGQRVGLAQTTFEGLPDKPIDLDRIKKKLTDADAENERQRRIAQKKNDLGAAAARIGVDKMRNLQTIETQKETIARLEQQLKVAKDGLIAAQQQDARLADEHAAAEKAFHNAPDAQYVDAAALGQELIHAQSTNAAIERRTRYDALVSLIKAKQAAADALTDSIAMRRRTAEQAIKETKLPVEGLELKTWTVGASEQAKRDVLFKGLPMENLSEGEQIVIAAEILMAVNPKLHALFIKRGESLDDKCHTKLLDLAIRYDFQIWMATLDTTGTTGLELTEGVLKPHHYPKQPVTIDAAKPKTTRKKK